MYNYLPHYFVQLHMYIFKIVYIRTYIAKNLLMSYCIGTGASADDSDDDGEYECFPR